MRPAGSPGGPAQGPASPNAPSPLSDYVGTYGDRTLSIVDGKLHVQRPNGRLLELLPTGRDTFGIAGILLGPVIIGMLKATLDTVTGQESWKLLGADGEPGPVVKEA